MESKANKKYASDNAVHKKIMFDIINDIFDSSIKSALGFKGGTLCFFMYGLDRFSVDLDFDVIKDISLDAIKKEVKNILIPYGKIQEETNTKIILKYDEHQTPLKIEFNQRVQKHDTYEVVNFFGKPIVAMTKDCIVTNKLVALTQRHEEKEKLASRDLYDIYFFLKNNFPINQELLKERTGKDTKHYFTDLLKFIPSHFTSENVLRGLGELVDEKQKYWIKNKLIQEVTALISFTLWNS
ncbi:MAG: nucleotidyl transferase AbiEii/AbiGii toxin family protein [Candidatus Absconditabacterales bacterium]